MIESQIWQITSLSCERKRKEIIVPSVLIFAHVWEYSIGQFRKGCHFPMTIVSRIQEKVQMVGQDLTFDTVFVIPRWNADNHHAYIQWSITEETKVNCFSSHLLAYQGFLEDFLLLFWMRWLTLVPCWACRIADDSIILQMITDYFTTIKLLDIVKREMTRIQILYMPYISRGFYFCKFRESGALNCPLFVRQSVAKINLPPIPTQECDLCMRILAVQYTVHVQMSEWYWFLRPPSMIALLIDSEFNHS